MLDAVKKREIVKRLFGAQVVFFPENKDSSGDIRPYSINLQRLTFYPDTLRFVGHVFGEAIRNVEFNMIAGPYTDIPLGTTISLEFGWPMLFVRGERKDHGTERLIEGEYRKGQNVVVVDDEISSVADTLQLLGRLEGSGLTVVGVFVLLDRGYGAIEAVAKRGYCCEALISLNDILLELSQLGKIPKGVLEKIRSYLENERKEFMTKLSSAEKNVVS